MTNSKHTKYALLTSVLSVAVCVTMLVGSTFAWFTDSVTSGNNKIVAGNLDIKLSYQNKTMTAFQEVTATTTDLFVNSEGSEILWEPGAAAVSYLKLENEGSLALKYQLAVNAKDVVTGPDGAALSKVLKTAVVAIEKTAVGSYTRETAIAAAKAEGAESVLTYVKEGTMEANTAPLYLAMIIYFPEEAGNKVDGALYNRGDVKLETDLSLKLVATQHTSEKDSFDNQYDKDAKYPILVSTPDGLKTALTNGGKITLADDVKVTNGIQLYVEKDTAIDFNGKTFKGAFYSGSTHSGSSDVNLVLSDPGNNGNYSIDGELVRHDGGGMTQTAAVAVWQPTVTIESGKYTHDNAVINCQLQTTDPKAVGAVINGGIFDGKGNASVVANIFGTVIINGGTFNAHKESTGSGECVYVSYGNSYVPSVTVINNGTFNAESHIFYIQHNKNYEQKIEVKGGTYTVAAGGKLVEVSDGTLAKDVLVITGGTFNVDPTDYVDTANYKVTKSDNLWTVTAK